MFLGRAKKFFQDLATEPESRVQYFNVACASGHRIRGERTEGYQALRCPVCSDGIFVLPRSPLPEPIAPPSVAARRPAGISARHQQDDGPIQLADATHMAVDLDDRAAPGAEIEIDWENDPIAKAERQPSANPAEASGKPRASVPRSEAVDQAQPVARVVRAKRIPTSAADHPLADTVTRSDRRSPVAAALLVAPAEPFPVRVRRLVASVKRRRNQIIFASVPLLVVAAVAWRVGNLKRQEYPLIVERGKTEGIEALDDGNFDKAYQLLSAAKSAVNALGGEIEDADKVRQAADEAAIFNDRCSKSLEEMLEEAARATPDEWASSFGRLYKGKSVIIDSWILSTGGDGKPYTIAYKVFPPGQPSSFRDGAGSRPDRYADIDLTKFELFELAGPRAGDRVTFGARLAKFQYDVDRDRWIVGFEPSTGVFIQHTKALDASGWADDSSSKPSSELLP